MKAHRVLPALLISLAFIAVLLVYLHSPGSPGGSTSEIHVRLIVSRDFGSTVILEEALTLEEDATALEALRIVSDVEATYGGRFVTSINGFERGGMDGVQVDWLYYINGFLAPVGAADYILREGDVERWDLHPWSSLPMASAIIGDYPEPFLHGYGGDRYPTLILYSDDFRSEAESLEGHLSSLGVEAYLKPMGEAVLGDESLGRFNLIIIGYFKDDLPIKLYEIHDRLGYYAYYDKGGVVHALDWRGSLHSFEGDPDLSLIQASRNPWSLGGTSATSRAAWLITGSTPDSVGSAVEALIQGKTSNLHGLLMVDGEYEPLPLSPREEGEP
ncbi:MAG: DUF4430 domain-containing protein [Candidatus Bathyarchaeia archaeon]